MEVCGCHALHTYRCPYGDQEVTKHRDDRAISEQQTVGDASKNAVLTRIVEVEKKSSADGGSCHMPFLMTYIKGLS